MLMLLFKGMVSHSVQEWCVFTQHFPDIDDISFLMNWAGTSISLRGQGSHISQQIDIVFHTLY